MARIDNSQCTAEIMYFEYPDINIKSISAGHGATGASQPHTPDRIVHLITWCSRQL